MGVWAGVGAGDGGTRAAARMGVGVWAVPEGEVSPEGPSRISPPTP